jgi:hypothetical protein
MGMGTGWIARNLMRSGWGMCSLVAALYIVSVESVGGKDGG